MFDVLTYAEDVQPHIPSVRVVPSGNGLWQVLSDGEPVGLCKSQDRAGELAFSIVSAACGFRQRVMGA